MSLKENMKEILSDYGIEVEDSITDELIPLIKEWAKKEVIGENEKEPIAHSDYEDMVEWQARNALRSEQRKKVEEL